MSTVRKEYKFEVCEISSMGGKNITIPAGIWLVAESEDSVLVFVNGRAIEFHKNQFLILKINRRAILMGSSNMTNSWC